MPGPVAPMPNINRNIVARYVVRLLRVLDGKRYMPRLEDIAAEMGVSKRTVCRYLDALELEGWPLPKRGWHKSEAA